MLPLKIPVFDLPRDGCRRLGFFVLEAHGLDLQEFVRSSIWPKQSAIRQFHGFHPEEVAVDAEIAADCSGLHSKSRGESASGDVLLLVNFLSHD